MFGQHGHLRAHAGALLLQEMGDGCVAQSKMCDPVRAFHLHRQIATLNLMLALRSGLDPFQSMGDGEIDRLVIAGLEMQEFEIRAAAPVAAIERVGAQQVQCARHPLAVPPRQDQDDAVGHGSADAMEEILGQIGRTPFAVGRVDIEAVEHVPMLGLQVAAGQGHHLDIGAGDLLAFLADAFALSR